jgi:acetyl esterase/lipase
MNLLRFTSLMLLLLCVFGLQAQTGERYAEPVFDNVLTTSEIPFSSVYRVGATSPTTLYLDFYEPSGDTLQSRPLVITVFGGAFVAGSRNYVDMQAYCNRFAQHGYAAASIDYRLLPFTSFNTTSLIRNAYMAAQDVSSAIRFFKAYSQEYRIDTNNIFLLGNSAGSISILNEIFLGEDERPAETFNEPDLGGMHTSGYDEYANFSPKVAGAIAQWGGVMDVAIIDSSEYVPLCMIHGTADDVVFYDSGYCYSSYFSTLLPFMYGSHTIANRLDDLGIEDYELHAFEGKDHCFYLTAFTILLSDEFDTCFNISRNFLYRNLKLPTPTSVPDIINKSMRVYPNPTDDVLCVELSGAGIANVVLFDLLGRIVETVCTPFLQGIASINVRDVPAGIYLLQVTDENGKEYHRKIIVK